MNHDWVCGAKYRQCGCGSWVEHLERNPCIEELGRMILAEQKKAPRRKRLRRS